MNGPEVGGENARADAPRSDRRWCLASGSATAYRILPYTDEVRCFVCGRYLFLTTWLRLPRHLERAS